eukprot:Amastigsp_a850101_9.p2 type:complete len:316 gc:universal Amastigsp_a850101_9:384-1331(+)
MWARCRAPWRSRTARRTGSRRRSRCFWMPVTRSSSRAPPTRARWHTSSRSGPSSSRRLWMPKGSTSMRSTASLQSGTPGSTAASPRPSTRSPRARTRPERPSTRRAASRCSTSQPRTTFWSLKTTLISSSPTAGSTQRGARRCSRSTAARESSASTRSPKCSRQAFASGGSRARSRWSTSSRSTRWHQTCIRRACLKLLWQSSSSAGATAAWTSTSPPCRASTDDAQRCSSPQPSATSKVLRAGQHPPQACSSGSRSTACPTHTISSQQRASTPKSCWFRARRSCPAAASRRASARRSPSRPRPTLTLGWRALPS